jgi:UDP-N-acetylglucosamine 2-epimerase
MLSKSIRRIDCIVYARPNFVKIAPIMRALKARGTFAVRLIIRAGITTSL